MHKKSPSKLIRILCKYSIQLSRRINQPLTLVLALFKHRTNNTVFVPFKEEESILYAKQVTKHAFLFDCSYRRVRDNWCFRCICWCQRVFTHKALCSGLQTNVQSPYNRYLSASLPDNSNIYFRYTSHLFAWRKTGTPFLQITRIIRK